MKPFFPGSEDMTRAFKLAHFQVGYVTTDLREALKIFSDHYGAKKPRIIRGISGESTSPAGKIPMTVNLATAQVGNIVYELIEPVTGIVDIYSDPLPKDGFGLVFHHLGFEVLGDEDEWLALREQLRASSNFALEGPENYPIRAVYMDERDRLGHYQEYIWYAPGTGAKSKSEALEAYAIRI
jgi:hypothetical protein